MIEPKQDVYTILKTVAENVYQSRPEIEVKYPCLIFQVTENTPEYVLEKGIGFQRIEITIDIYDKTSKGSGELLATLTDTMMENDYRLVFSSDIPNDEGSHITTRFNLAI